MKIENLERASRAKDELKELNKALKTFEKMGEKEAGNLGLVIGEHNDSSGNAVSYQYVNGNYHPMYAEILEMTKKRFEQARDDLVLEIKSL